MSKNITFEPPCVLSFESVARRVENKEQQDNCGDSFTHQMLPVKGVVTRSVRLQYRRMGGISTENRTGSDVNDFLPHRKVGIKSSTQVVAVHKIDTASIRWCNSKTHPQDAIGGAQAPAGYS